MRAGRSNGKEGWNTRNSHKLPKEKQSSLDSTFKVPFSFISLWAKISLLMPLFVKAQDRRAGKAVDTGVA